jgi:hypothetical protein
MRSFGQLAAMVSEQSEMIQRIDANTYVPAGLVCGRELRADLSQRRGGGQRRGGAKRAAQVLVPCLGQPVADSQDVWCTSMSTALPVLPLTRGPPDIVNQMVFFLLWVLIAG